MNDTYLSPGSLRPVRSTFPAVPVGHRGSTENGGRLEKACAEFEALFINHLLKELRATVEKSGLMDGGQAEEVFTGMMDAEIARDLASKGGIGLAAILFRQLNQAGAEPVETAAAAPVRDLPPTEKGSGSKVMTPLRR